MMSVSIITRFYCINFEFSVPRLNWLGTYLLRVTKRDPSRKGQQCVGLRFDTYSEGHEVRNHRPLTRPSRESENKKPPWGNIRNHPEGK